jgi:hypothetical protein
MAILSLERGNARNVMQSMDKQDLIHYLWIIALCLAAWGGYVAGSFNG